MHLCLGRGEDSNGGKLLSIFWEELDELSVAFCWRERGSKTKDRMRVRRLCFCLVAANLQACAHGESYDWTNKNRKRRLVWL